MSNSIPSVAQLHRAIKIAEQIQSLEAELAAILGNAGAPVTKSVAPTASAPKAKMGKRKYTKRAASVVSDASAATDAAVLSVLGKKKRKKSQMSAEGRAAIVAAQKARWAKVRKAKAKA